MRGLGRAKRATGPTEPRGNDLDTVDEVANKLTPALVLAGWTAVVWTTRLRNIWTDDALSTTGQVSRSALALIFTGFAVAVAVLWVRSRRHAEAWPGEQPLVRAFAMWTVSVWVIRGVQIALGDHSIGFVAVHFVLAAASIGLAVWADASVKLSRSTAGRVSRRN